MNNQARTQESSYFLGLSLGGGKTDKACLAVIEYFGGTSSRKVFLAKLIDKIKSDIEISADLKIFEHIQQYRSRSKSLCLDVALNLPLCLRCKLDCPGFEACNEPHIRWMWSNFEKRFKSKKPKRLFTPYTQRSADMYALSELEEPFFVSHAMGANSAPLMARAQFITRRIVDLEILEVLSNVSIWRLGAVLGVGRTHLKRYNSAVSGAESRQIILAKLSQKAGIFFYEQDLRVLIASNQAFEAFIAAYVGFLKYNNLTEPRPASFPEREDWLLFPKQDWLKNLSN